MLVSDLFIRSLPVVMTRPGRFSGAFSFEVSFVLVQETAPAIRIKAGRRAKRCLQNRLGVRISTGTGS